MESNRGSVILGKSERQAVGINHCPPTTAAPERPLVKHEIMQHRIDDALTEVEHCLESLAARLFCEPVSGSDRSRIEPCPLPACFAEMGAMVQTRCEEIRDVINRIENGLFDG